VQPPFPVYVELKIRLTFTPLATLKLLDKIPRPVRTFLLKAAGIFLGWQLLDRLYLIKVGIPNHFLTRITGLATSSCLAPFFPDAHAVDEGYKTAIVIHGQRAVGIADPCNALEIFVLYLAFLLCYPSTPGRRLAFAAVGLPTIFIANILRCMAITTINMYRPDWVDVSHHYIFTTLVYLLVFYLWMLFTGKSKNVVAES
jgi:exosortase/archaeosortase family protein